MSCYSNEIESQIRKIYEKLAGVFSKPALIRVEIKRALAIMKSITPHAKDNAAQKSYDLFHAAMQAKPSSNYSRKDQMEVARIAMEGAFKWDKSLLPPVGDPDHIVEFIRHYFLGLSKADMDHTGTKEHLEAIRNALCAVVYDPGTINLDGLRRIIREGASRFVGATGRVFHWQDSESLQLHKAALLFLPHFSNDIFNDNSGISVDRDLKDYLCTGWASALVHVGLEDGAWVGLGDGVKEAALTVLFDMINSNWLPHITENAWEFLASTGPSVPGDFPAFRRCLDNSESMRRIGNLGSPRITAIWADLEGQNQSRPDAVVGGSRMGPNVGRRGRARR